MISHQGQPLFHRRKALFPLSGIAVKAHHFIQYSDLGCPVPGFLIPGHPVLQIYGRLPFGIPVQEPVKALDHLPDRGTSVRAPCMHRLCGCYMWSEAALWLLPVFFFQYHLSFPLCFIFQEALVQAPPSGKDPPHGWRIPDQDPGRRVRGCHHRRRKQEEPGHS